MPIEITMPQLSDTMSEGTIVKWLKKEGDKVAANEVVAEVETDKATMEMESFEGGTMAAVLIPEGGKAAVGATIAALAKSSEKLEDVKAKFAGGAKTSAASPVSGNASSASATQSTQPLAVSRSRQDSASAAAGNVGRRSADLNSPHESTEKAEDGEAEGPEHDPHAGKAVADLEKHHAEAHKIKVHHEGSNGNGRVKVSPLARRVAVEKNIDLQDLTGTGPGGRIVRADVLAYAEHHPAELKPAAGANGNKQTGVAASVPNDKPARAEKPALPVRVPSGQTEKVQLSKMRVAIATALQNSKRNVPHFYETIDIEMTAANALRQKLLAAYEKSEGVRISIGDVIAKAVAVALKTVPQLNATFDEKANTITRHGDVNLGMAVALPDGLIVPVLRHIDQMGFKEIRERSGDLVSRARAQKLKREELSGATFTVSNLGTMGIREFSAIVNPPEVGILAIGAGEDRAVVRNGQVVVKNMMTVTLSCDHRVIDGAVAAHFLSTLKSMLEEPAMMLV